MPRARSSRLSWKMLVTMLAASLVPSVAAQNVSEQMFLLTVTISGNFVFMSSLHTGFAIGATTIWLLEDRHSKLRSPLEGNQAVPVKHLRRQKREPNFMARCP